MGMIHDLIETKGKRGALLSGEDRAPVEVAASYMADEDTGIGFIYSGLCQAALPHKRLPSTTAWQITSDHITLVVDPGSKPGFNNTPEPVGVPYGSRARLIMLYLQSEAIRTSSRQVHLGRSMREWLKKMGVPIGGKSMQLIRDQAERISWCRLSFNFSANRGTQVRHRTIVDDAMFLDSNDGVQGSLFLETAKLSEFFFEELQRHSVPLEDAAIRAISNNSMALDLYAWLAFRLHALKASTPISWAALKGQFGSGFKSMHHFEAYFCDNLKLALAVYRDARLEVTERGVTLMPSRPPVAPKQIASR
jgi:replication initiator protein